MDKKQLAAIVASVVERVQVRAVLEESEARTLVGIAIRANADAIVEAVLVPSLGLVPKTAQQPAVAA